MDSIDRSQYPQLNLILWDDARRHIEAEEAFSAYERRWQYVDVPQLLPQEQALIRALEKIYAKGRRQTDAMIPQSVRHCPIHRILQSLSPRFLVEHKILFGGDARIVLELNDYRVAGEMALCCLDQGAYRAARSQVTGRGLGDLLLPGTTLNFTHEVWVGRNAIRARFDGDPPVTLDIIRFDGNAMMIEDTLFPIPAISRVDCYTTKLLAIADSWTKGYKDIVDLLMMVRTWGSIPLESWKQADKQYAKKVVCVGLANAVANVLENPDEAIGYAVNNMGVDRHLAAELVEGAYAFLNTILRE